MADRGLMYQSFENGLEQLIKTEVKEGQVIGSVRIYWAGNITYNVLAKLKFRQIRNEIPLILHGPINQTRTECAVLHSAIFPLIVNETTKETQEGVFKNKKRNGKFLFNFINPQNQVLYKSTPCFRKLLKKE